MIDLLPYALLVLIISVVFGLLTSKVVAEKLVTAGLLPRSFLNLVPLLHFVLRAFGVMLILIGLISIGITSGWLNPDAIRRFGVPSAVVALGVILLVFGARKDS